MVTTIEPGIYVAPGTPGVRREWWGIGVRLEDDVVVTTGAPEVLTEAMPKDPDEIERLMAAA
jgi:Xaa-Pro aminopeptidase